MKSQEINRVYRETFDSLADFADYAERRFYGDLDAPGESWEGDVSMREALELARHGWQDQNDALAIAEDAVETLEREGLISQFNRPVWDVTGSDVDVSRYLSGEPECMIEMPLDQTKGRVPTVVMVKSFTYLATSDDDVLREHGRLVVALVLALEKLGVPVEIWADRPLFHAHTPTGKYYQRVLIKGGGDYLDAGQLMFAMVHPAMLRRLGFAVHASATPRPRSRDEKDLYGEGAILTETIPADTDAVTFLKNELARMGLLAESE